MIADATIRAVTEYFRHFDAIDPDLGHRLTDYLIHDKDAEVLLTLPSFSTLPEHLALVYQNWEKLTESLAAGRHPSALYSKLTDDDVAFHYRLIGVFTAVNSPNSNAQRITHRVAVPAHLPDWLVALLSFMKCEPHGGLLRGRQVKTTVPSAPTVAAMLVLDGLPADILLATVLDADPRSWQSQQFVEACEGLADFRGYLAAHAALLRTKLLQADNKHRQWLLEFCHRHEADLSFMAPEVLDWALGDAKGVQAQAERYLVTWQAAGIAQVTAALGAGTPKKRLLAAQLLHRLAGEAAREALHAHREIETTAAVRDGIAALLAGPSFATTVDVALPPQPDLDLTAQLPVELELPLADELNRVWQLMAAQHEHHVQWWQRQDRAREPEPLPAFDAAALAATLRYWLNCADMSHPPPIHWLPRLSLESGFQWALRNQNLDRSLQFGLVHRVRWRALSGWFAFDADARHSWRWTSDHDLTDYLEKMGWGLRELATCLDFLGLDSENLGIHYLYDYHIERQRPADFLWPYFATHFSLLETALRGSKEHNRYTMPQMSRGRAMDIIGKFPQLPQEFVPILFDIAINGGKQDRLLAQKTLGSIPDKLERICSHLQAKQQATRQNAAEWLGQLKDRRAITSLEIALKKEKHGATKATMLVALEKIGGDLTPYLNPTALEAEAEITLQKGIPDELSWFGFNRLPELHWKTGEMVNPRIIHGWLVTAYRLKSVEPNPLWRRYFEDIRPNEAVELGNFILDSWIAQDTRAYSQHDAEAYAKKELPGLRQWMNGRTDEEILQQLIKSRLNECLGSAIKEKGLLALVATIQPPRLVTITQQFLQRWGGNRHHQSQALLTALSWSQHSAAIQLLLATTRSRVKPLRELAHAKVQELADRQGWTLTQLAERTVPTANLDEQGGFDLDYGRTQFRVNLHQTLKFVIFRQEDNKPIKSLPAARQGDEAEKVKEAKALFAAAKKELAGVLQQQPERLYEAMTAQRTWEFAEWRQYFAQHPIIKFLIQRLLWTGNVGDTTTVFRPLEDGSLTDVEDNPVDFPDEAVISLTHGSLLTAAERDLWRQHGKDYTVNWLFEQLNAPPDWSKIDKDSREITNFRGYIVDAFTLRGELTKRGFNRGETGDGAWFTTYLKPFPASKLQMEIEFTGNTLPEENRQTALIALRFLPISATGDSWVDSQQAHRLADVSSILLAEGYELLALLASKGNGFNNNWEKIAYA